jgi:DNA-directed RNA polymerase subunit N (RpoN/RPB10)
MENIPKCPHCGKTLNRVSAYFEHYRRVNLKEENLEDSETIFDEMTDAECWACGESVLDLCKGNDEIMRVIQEIS